MNYKVKYKMIRNLINSVFLTGEKSELVDLVIEKKTVDDLDIMSLLNMVEYLNSKDFLTVKDITHLYKNILPTQFRDELGPLDNFYSYFNKNKKNISRISKYILQYNTFNDFSFIMMILLINYLYFKETSKFLVFFTPVKENLTKLSKKTFTTFDEAFNLIKDLNLEYYVKFKVLSLDEVTNLIKKIPDHFFDLYNVSSLYIFGSYAKGKQTEYSDLDILIELNETLKKYFYVTGNTFSIEIQALTGIRCDVHVKSINDKPTDFERNILKHAIKIK